MSSPAPRPRALVLGAGVALLVAACAGLACRRAQFGEPADNNIACQCDETQCPTAELDFEWPQDGASLVLVVSDKAGARFQVTRLALAQARATSRPAPGDRHRRLVHVDAARPLQRVLGYGGAFTDSASMLLANLGPRLRAATLASYFGARGLAYNLARVPIGGTDMSWRAYSYDDLAPGKRDLELAHFRLQEEDLRYKLPLIKQVNELRRAEGHGSALKLIATSWSAPGWMKTNNSLVQGELKGDPEGAANGTGAYYDAYARYTIRFLDEYERQLNATIWALTPQNEPFTPGYLGARVVNYNSVNFAPNQMRDYLRYHLVPRLIEAGRSGSSLALFVWDDTLVGLARYQEALLADAQVRAYARGLAYHWYGHALGRLPYRALYDTRRALPAHLDLVSTEASYISHPRPGEWARGAQYARDIIENLRAGAGAWLDWNLALDMRGGPSWSANYLDAAVLVDAANQTTYKSPMFYAIGHVSRFLPAGARLLASWVTDANGAAPADHGPPADEQLLVVAGELGAGEPAAGGARQLALVLLNRWPARLRAELRLTNCGSALAREPLQLELAADSITSVALNC